MDGSTCGMVRSMSDLGIMVSSELLGLGSSSESALISYPVALEGLSSR